MKYGKYRKYGQRGDDNVNGQERGRNSAIRGNVTEPFRADFIDERLAAKRSCLESKPARCFVGPPARSP